MKFKLAFILIFCSCSLFNTEVEQPFAEYDAKENLGLRNKDYADHLSSLAEDYINSPDIHLVRLNKASLNYFNQRYKEIVADNELLLDNKKIKPRFYVVKDKTPFYFSLPGGTFFFSLGLLKKYLRNEELFIAVLTFEMVRVHKNIFKKNAIVPIGYMRTERILSLVRLDIDTKQEVAKWTYFSMKRAGYDPSAYLIWLQTQNRNILDFVVQRGDSRSISREEFIFKNFVATQGIDNLSSSRKEVNSSSKFYKMINHMKKVAL